MISWDFMSKSGIYATGSQRLYLFCFYVYKIDFYSYRNIVYILSSLLKVKMNNLTIFLVAVIYGIMCFEQQLMMHFIQYLSLNFHSFLDLYLNGSSSSVDSNQWYCISTSYWVENLKLSSCLSIKSTHEFKWYKKTLWHNGM